MFHCIIVCNLFNPNYGGPLYFPNIFAIIKKVLQCIFLYTLHVYVRIFEREISGSGVDESKMMQVEILISRYLSKKIYLFFSSTLTVVRMLLLLV